MLQRTGLSPGERAAIGRALASDPALADELEAIARLLRPAARDRFWHAFAAECADRHRPAAGTAAALVRAVLH